MILAGIGRTRPAEVAGVLLRGNLREEVRYMSTLTLRAENVPNGRIRIRVTVTRDDHVVLRTVDFHMDDGPWAWDHWNRGALLDIADHLAVYLHDCDVFWASTLH